MLFRSVVTFVGLLWPLWQSWKKREDDGDGALTQQSPFSLWQALKFGAFVLLVLVVSFVLRQLFGVQGIYLTALLTGLVDVDAFILSMVHLTLQDERMLVPASHAVLIAVGSNMVVKSLITCIFGRRAFAFTVAGVLFLSVVAAVGAVILGFLST